MTKKPNPHRGSTLDDFLKSEGILEESKTAATRSVIAWRVEAEMERTGMTKTELAVKLGTSRADIARLLDPDDDNVTLRSLQRAAVLIGRKLRVDLV